MTRLEERIQKDLTDAMRAKDPIKMTALRQLKAALGEAKVKLGNAHTELTEAQASEVVGKLMKRYEDSTGQYKSAGRTDLLESEQAEMDVIAEYAPEPLSDECIEAFFRKSVTAGIRNFGELMGALKKYSANSTYDGKRAAEILKGILK